MLASTQMGIFDELYPGVKKFKVPPRPPDVEKVLVLGLCYYVRIDV